METVPTPLPICEGNPLIAMTFDLDLYLQGYLAVALPTIHI